MAYVYIIRCEDGTLYTGSTKDLKRRMNQHFGLITTGRAKYTRSHKPKKIEAVWETKDFSQALKFESAIKKMKRAEKEKLIYETVTREWFESLFPKLSDLYFQKIQVSLEDLLVKPKENKEAEM